MNVKEAREALSKGERLTHPDFSDDEWVEGIPSGDYIFEDGVRCTPDEFWRYRETIPSMRINWTVKEKTNES